MTGSDGGTHHDGQTGNGDGPLGGDGGLAPGAPTITLNGPSPGVLIAGTLHLDVTVTAPSGVDNVTATIAGSNDIPMAAFGTMNDYQGSFNTVPLDGLLFPTIVVRARSKDGEDAEFGFEIALDNSPPIASLDPPNVRSTRLDPTAGIDCSADFDPLGPDAPNDGESVPQISELRARIVDRTNAGTFDSTVFVPVADVGKSQIYVLDDTTRPLVVDTDGDGICDSINPDIVPTIVPSASNEAAVIDLLGVPPAGTAFFPSNLSFGAPNNATCGTGLDIKEPEELCRGEPGLSIAIQTDFGTPEIFGIAPLTADNCTGFAFDAKASNISNGWACAAVSTVDKLGNASVSAPLRICIDSETSGATCAAWGTIAPAIQRPDCTGTVTGGVVTSTPCTPPKFAKPANDFELLALPP